MLFQIIFYVQGGVNSPFTMTAYVLITLKETDYASGDQVN